MKIDAGRKTVLHVQKVQILRVSITKIENKYAQKGNTSFWHFKRKGKSLSPFYCMDLLDLLQLILFQIN